MVGYDPQRKLLTYYDYAFAGAVSGAVSRALLQPLDVIKIRLQLQVEPTSQLSKYYGFSHAVMTIIREEGLRALWKGHIPAQLLTVVYGMVQFSTFEFLTKLSYKYLPREYSESSRPLINAACGSVAGGVSTVVVQPLDLLRTRFVAQGEPKIYKHFYSAGIEIVNKEGVFALWRGLNPALILVIPQTGLQFGFHTFFSAMLKRNRDYTSFSFIEQLKIFISGMGSGICAKLAVYPFDVVKKRLQVQGFETARKKFGKVRSYTGTWNCLRIILLEEGARGLLKGLFPTMLKAGSVSGVTFTVYEATCHILAYFR